MDLTKDLIVPTVRGDFGHTTMDLIYLPTYQELTETYHLKKEDLITNDENSSCGNFWLQNEKVQTMIQTPRLDAIEGFIEGQTGMQKVIIHYEKDFGPFKSKWKPDDFFLENKFGVRPCLRFDVKTYSHLMKVLASKNNDSYSPYRKPQKDYMCINFGTYPVYHKEKQIYPWGDDAVTTTPIAWRILNWQDLPKTINPQGSGKATTIDLFAENIVNEIPYLLTACDFDCHNYWQFSLVRSYLNGSTKSRVYNFLTEAFKKEAILLETIVDTKKQKANKKAQTIPQKKSSLAIENNPSVLKEEFITALKNNPVAILELVPVMKEFINAVESLTSDHTK